MLRHRGGLRAWGFTLIELLVVLALAGLLLAATPPLLSKALPGLQLKGTARQLAAGLRYARGHAVTQHTETALTLDLEERSATVSGRDGILSIPDDFKVDLVSTLGELESETRGSIRFYPDGTSTGGRITVRYKDQGYDVDIDWLTGRVSMAAVEPE